MGLGFICENHVLLHFPTLAPSLMMLAVSPAIALLLAFAGSTSAQFPAEPRDRKVLESRFGEGVTITYKEVRNQGTVYDFATSSADVRSRTPSVRQTRVQGPSQGMYIFLQGRQT